MSHLYSWQIVEGRRVRLEYEDGKVLFVTKEDFDRAFGCIIALTYDEAKRDFAIE